MAGHRHVWLLLAAMLLTQAPFTRGCFKRLVYHGQFPLLYVDDCTSNYDLGLLVGSTFSSMIKERLRDSIAFQKVTTYCRTNWGSQLLAALQSLHRSAFPAYTAELQGLAAGSGVPFDQIFMLNLRQEILAAGESPQLQQQLQRWLEQQQQQQQAAQGDGSSGFGSSGNIKGGSGRADIRLRGSGGVGAAEWESPDGPQGARGGSDAPLDGGGSGGGAAAAGAVQGGDSSREGWSGGMWVDPASVDACSDVGVRISAGGGGGEGAAPPPGGGEDGGDDTGGSDPGLQPPRVLLLGHNEDMTNDTLGRMYYIRANMPGRGTWFALTYAGELASTAFGANSAGVAFTLNALYPSAVQLPGLGRNFLSRRLLDAGSVAEAMDVLLEPGQATGRSVNLMHTRPPLAVWNVEVGPGASHDERRLGRDDWYFHANAYMRLPVPQKLDNSSVHREARAAQFDMPTSAQQVLQLLGDTADPDFPIFRTGDYGGLVYTLCTALYDLVGGRLSVYRGNPREGVLGSVLSLHSLMPLEEGGSASQQRV